MPFELVKLFSFKWENAQLNGFKQALRVTKSRTRLKQFSIHTHTQTKRKGYLIYKKKMQCRVVAALVSLIPQGRVSFHLSTPLCYLGLLVLHLVVPQ